MGDEKKLVHQYELKQRILKKENKKYIKRIPYYIFGFVFLTFGLIKLFDGKLNSLTGNSSNLIIIIVSIISLIALIYLITTYRKIKNNKKKIKDLGSQLYRIMKL